MTDTQPAADVSERHNPSDRQAAQELEEWLVVSDRVTGERIRHFARLFAGRRAAGMREAVAELRPFLFHPETCDSQHELNDGWHVKPCNCGYEENLDRLEGRDG